MPKPGGKLVRVTVAAEALGLCHETVRRWIRTKRISGVRIARNWYVHRESLEKIMATRCTVDT